MRSISLILLFISLVACSQKSNESKAQELENKATSAQTTNEKFADGPYKEYHKTGEIKIVGTYKNGLRSGLWSSWFTNGNLQSEVEYKQGKEYGEYQVFYEEGQLKIKGQYNEGKEIGIWVFYDANGKEVARKDYSL